MDLATILKDVKARKYNTKEEFAVDSNLIWENCSNYNNRPVRIYIMATMKGGRNRHCDFQSECSDARAS
jgi:hypothetical protein